MSLLSTDGFMRHIRACNTATLPGQRLPLRINGVLAGYADPEIAAALKEMGLADDSTSGGLSLSDPTRLESIGEELARQGFYRTHNELFDVWGDDGQPPLGRIDRGALPLFGFVGVGVHLNGLVRKEDGLHLWVGRRARNKRLDPGKLDHLVAGGVPAGLTPDIAIIKEAEEEASLPPYLVKRDAKKVGLLHYALERLEGLRRDRLVCYDLVLAESFQPAPADGEVEEFLLLPIGEVFRLVRDTDEFKFNVNLVLIDLFLRTGLIDPLSEEGVALRQGLQGGTH
ncbi:NUDIX hydrolase [Acetobacter sp.]|jgi:8-oxo-dGTP pyrophosphatase MutT (NUDIX family)|uniref:NUDIX hydrolase n=1 Tax=Acetobacter sp. TaxID=440 RepID=UPI0025BC0B3C|nr:NUDIX domain-containing protein [Acetobacter sp.]MCH4091452.1 NUDIX domain-containing protein [Acetobacter sp.]MCI1299430.1 NUDIX domain-containing protein [Acetobacter sp.]MCI1316980.1 NUDIX domain-containing protein [Acetobacter sp.]